MGQFGERVARALEEIRRRKPLIHHITNFVVMNDTANITLHVGALPVMAHAAQEVAEMVSAAGALVLNPGTLSPEWVEAMLVAGRRASELGIPIVLDPVGAGATSLRTESNRRLLEELQIAIVRGNSGEIGALAGLGGQVRGVEVVEELKDPLQAARFFAQRFQVTVAITGRRDVISDGEWVLGVDNGHPMLKTITGSGCMATTMVAAFAAVEGDPVLAAAGGLACYGLAAERAALNARGPASFKVNLLDEVYNLDRESVLAGEKVLALS